MTERQIPGPHIYITVLFGGDALAVESATVCHGYRKACMSRAGCCVRARDLT